MPAGIGQTQPDTCGILDCGQLPGCVERQDMEIRAGQGERAIAVLGQGGTRQWRRPVAVPRVRVGECAAVLERNVHVAIALRMQRRKPGHRPARP